MLKKLISWNQSGKKFMSVSSQKFNFQIIENPIGFQAAKVSIFSEHFEEPSSRPQAFLRQNQKTCLTDVKVFYPKNILVGIDIYYEPTSTLGFLDHDLGVRTVESYMIYNQMIKKLPEMIDDEEKND